MSERDGRMLRRQLVPTKELWHGNLAVLNSDFKLEIIKYAMLQYDFTRLKMALILPFATSRPSSASSTE